MSINNIPKPGELGAIGPHWFVVLHKKKKRKKRKKKRNYRKRKKREEEEEEEEFGLIFCPEYRRSASVKMHLTTHGLIPESKTFEDIILSVLFEYICYLPVPIKGYSA
jgi:hypothetical protein